MGCKVCITGMRASATRCSSVSARKHRRSIEVSVTPWNVVVSSLDAVPTDSHRVAKRGKEVVARAVEVAADHRAATAFCPQR